MTDTALPERILLLGNTPTELTNQIATMRRDPTDFYLRGRVSCALGCDRKGARSAYRIGHVAHEDAGSWCPVHGWLSFASDAIHPTERLTASEIEDRKLTERRKRRKFWCGYCDERVDHTTQNCVLPIVN